ncbi:MAG: DUF2239 family protein [Deltaproteobacteria bacterium]|nr:DUF2239 family protein [Deltaproteobacteria bacterium]
MNIDSKLHVAFVGEHLLARGPLSEVAMAMKARLEAGEKGRIALYEDESGRVLDLDLRGTDEEALARLPGGAAAPPSKRGPGRPKLGVTSREISLLPRHWEWLAGQRGGASATLRRLVDEARKAEVPAETLLRRALDAAHAFLSDLSGDRAGFEEVLRALYAKDVARVGDLVADWPHDIREQLERYLERASAALARQG